MSSPRTDEAERIEIVPFIIFALLLIVPFLNFEFTFYRATLKLFVFQCATTVLWGYVLWQWAAGRVRVGEWPAWWLFAPLGAWVGWGLATAAWSRHGWLTGQGVVEGFYGLLGAAGLAVLLRERGLRRVFLTASSAVVFVLAVLMIVFYGTPRSGFFGDLDVAGREVGAAFLLVPTVVVGALLYGRPGERRDVERVYGRVFWLAALLVVLLAAGVRASSAAWAYGLGAGVVVAAGLLLPRFRPLVVAVAALVVVLAVVHERKVAERALGPVADPRTREALLDRVEWGLALRRPAGRVLAGDGVGTLLLELDVRRPPETYAISYGDMVEGHTRRAVTEVVFERGLVGLVLALAAGAACLAAGVLAFWRARDPGDAALGAGLAAGVVAMGAYACLGNGTTNFGAGVIFWMAVGLRGAWSVGTARASGLSWSVEEELGRRDEPAGLGWLRGPAAIGGRALLVGLWVVAGLLPFWGSLALRDGRSELETTRALGAQRAEAEQMLAGLRHAGRQRAKELAKDPELADRLQRDVERAEGRLRLVAEDYRESVARARASLARASWMTLDGRVRLNAEISLVMADLAAVAPKDALARYQALEARCGSGFDLDLLGATCYAALDRPADAHKLLRQYAQRNPLAATCALFHTNSNLYERWLLLIEHERVKPEPHPQWREWAWDYTDACARGLAVFPEHYGLLMHYGEMLYRLERDDESYDLQMAAGNIIRYHLAVRRYGPRLTANLLLDLANTYMHWDKRSAVAAVNRIGSGNLGIDFSLPMYRDIFQKAVAMKSFLDPAAAREARDRLRRQRAAFDAERAPATPTAPEAGPPASDDAP